uniref:Fatty acyl-CoA reductase n=2 Tax=Lygus hesperus TaxID=30085 RepID=A0A0A9W6J2_LYGHE
MINVRGTREMVLLCREMNNLKALIHVSTAYSNFRNSEIDEEFYDPPLTADELIYLCERMGDGDLSITTKKFLEGWPNTYVFTKCVAEEAIKAYAAGIPTCIFRPAVIICTKREPMEGWIDNYNGPSGLISLVESGFARVARADPISNADLVPADMCVNVIMSAGQKVGTLGFDGEIKIFNFASSSRNSITWGNFTRYFVEAGKHLPSDKAVWCPGLILLKSKLLYSLVSFIYHIIPAFLVDMCLLICHRRPRALKLSRKVSKFLHLISDFSCKSWRFSNDNLTALWKGLSPTDKVLFDFDLEKIDWKEMITVKVRGVRKYLLKEHERTIPSAQKRRFWSSGRPNSSRNPDSFDD